MHCISEGWRLKRMLSKFDDSGGILFGYCCKALQDVRIQVKK
jgi:hypothetical protein